VLLSVIAMTGCNFKLKHCLSQYSAKRIESWEGKCSESDMSGSSTVVARNWPSGRVLYDFSTFIYRFALRNVLGPLWCFTFQGHNP